MFKILNLKLSEQKYKIFLLFYIFREINMLKLCKKRFFRARARDKLLKLSGKI